MPRATTTSDAFNAVAEPRRRDILTFLAFEERSVGENCGRTCHGTAFRLQTLARIKRGRPGLGPTGWSEQLYRTEGAALRPLHEWIQTFERLWSQQLLRIKERAEKKS